MVLDLLRGSAGQEWIRERHCAATFLLLLLLLLVSKDDDTWMKKGETFRIGGLVEQTFGFVHVRLTREVACFHSNGVGEL
jgi:hypothetical protein